MNMYSSQATLSKENPEIRITYKLTIQESEFRYKEERLEEVSEARSTKPGISLTLPQRGRQEMQPTTDVRPYIEFSMSLATVDMLVLSQL